MSRAPLVMPKPREAYPRGDVTVFDTTLGWRFVNPRMQALYGSEFGRLDMREWIARAADGGMDPLISSYLESLVEKGRVIEFPYLGAEVGEF